MTQTSAIQLGKICEAAWISELNSFEVNDCQYAHGGHLTVSSGVTLTMNICDYI